MTVSLAPRTVLDTLKDALSVAASKEYIGPRGRVEIRLYGSQTVILLFLMFPPILGSED